MDFTQNKRITQITEQTLIIVVDIAKHKHVARGLITEAWTLQNVSFLPIHKKGLIN